MDKIIPESWGLGWSEIEKIYQVEVEQSDRLRNAAVTERRQLYSQVYEEYFRKLPFHPQLTIKQNNALKQDRANFQLRQILPLVRDKERFMEIGAGDCSLSIAVSKFCKEIIALEVSNEIADNSGFPDNVKLILFNGFDIPIEDNRIDTAYSNQLMEHLHPDDAEIQLKSIFRVMRKGGGYICITPNRLTGPHDISRFFSDRPTGFHLKEYSAGDLRAVFLQTGFSKVIAYTILKGRRVDIPFALVKITERLFESLPVKIKKIVLSFRPVKIILNVVVVAIK